MTIALAHLVTVLLLGAASALGVPAPATPHGGWPLSPTPVVVSGFDPPISAYGAGHRGVDLAGAPGQDVLASAAGRVTFAGSVAGRGVVVVSHGATRTTYEPVRAEVAVGTVVTVGQRLGTLEPFPSHCAPAACLHWGLIQDETYLDPLTLVGAGPVRLLPLDGLAPLAGTAPLTGLAGLLARRAGPVPVPSSQAPPGLAVAVERRAGDSGTDSSVAARSDTDYPAAGLVSVPRAV